jgi:hypothetical protein
MNTPASSETGMSGAPDLIHEANSAMARRRDRLLLHHL